MGGSVGVTVTLGMGVPAAGGSCPGFAGALPQANVTVPKNNASQKRILRIRKTDFTRQPAGSLRRGRIRRGLRGIRALIIKATFGTSTASAVRGAGKCCRNWAVIWALLPFPPPNPPPGGGRVRWGETALFYIFCLHPAVRGAGKCSGLSRRFSKSSRGCFARSAMRHQKLCH